MTTVNLIYVGNIRENYLLAAAAEYEKRLSAYCRLVCTELKEEKLPDEPSQAQIDAAIKKEGERILAVLPQKSKKIALCVEGKQISSEEFSSLLKTAESSGFSQISFIIGGAFGLSEEVKKVCDFRLSLSKMTFSHQMVRLIFVEQLYRALTILNHEPYHHE